MTTATTQPTIETATDETDSMSLMPQGKDAKLRVLDDSGFENLLDTAKFEHMWRVANLFSRSKLVPVHFQNKPEDCFVACQMAIRLNVDPFMFMQNTYVVGGKPGMEAKLAIALVNARGPFEGPIQWKLEGDGDTRKATAYATHSRTGEVCDCTVTVQMAKDEGWIKNPKWKTMTDQMLRYRSAAWLARLYAPECLMGMQTTDELADVVDQQERRFVANESTRADALNDRLKALDAGAAAEQTEVVNEQTGEVSETAKTAASDEAQNKAGDGPQTITTVIGAITGGKGKQPYTISTPDGDFTCTKIGVVNTISKAKGDGGEVEATLTVEGDVVTAVEIPE